MTEAEVFSRVSDILVEYLRLDRKELDPESHIVNDIGADSLALVELGFKFSEAFGVPMISPTPENLIIGNLARQIHGEMKP